MTRYFSAFSLNAPWNCVAIRLQKPRRHFFSGSFGEGVPGLAIRTDQSSGLKVSEIERFYQRFLQRDMRLRNSVTKMRRQYAPSMGLKPERTSCFPAFAATIWTTLRVPGSRHSRQRLPRL